MTPQERLKIEEALAAPNPTQTIPAVCREIVMDRIDCRENVERDLRFLVKDIIEASDFGCQVKLELTEVPGRVEVQKPNMKSALLYGVIGVASFIGAVVSEKAGIRGMFGLAAIASSFCAGRTLVSRQSVTPATTKAHIVSVSTADSIGAHIDKFTDSLTALFDYRQIETKYKEFLKWLQRQHFDVSDEIFKRDVERLLARFGYVLEEYSDFKMADFDISEANVPEPVTTIKALYTQDGRLISKGIYVVPVKK